MDGEAANPALRGAAAAVVLATAGLLLLAAALDMPAALGGGFFSDCATYYTLASSLGHDLDLEYARADIERSYSEFSGGPSGIFLQRHPDSRRMYFGKAYIYPAAIAPAVRLLGHRGPLATHALLAGALLLAMVVLWERRWGAWRALGVALGFLLPSMAVVYYFWFAPEFFNFCLVFAAYFLWLYKEYNPADEGERPPAWRAALLASWTDVAAAALLGAATYSKLSNGVMILPPLLFLLLRRRWWRLLLGCAAFGAAVVLLFGLQLAATGNWNYQGGERKSFSEQFPLANGRTFDDASATARETNVADYKPPFVPLDIAHNVLYFFVGRFGGIVPYYFPAALALVLFLFRGRGSSIRWLLLLGAAAAAAVYIVLIPTNVIGGGGTVANRYFMNIFPLFFFMLPERTPRWMPAAAALGGVLFAGHILATPIATSMHPASYSETPVLRLLPVEYTMLNDLPLNTESERRRVPWYHEPEEGSEERRLAFFLYHLDHNSYLKAVSPEGRQRLWVAGGRRSELVLRTVGPLEEIRIRVTNTSRANAVTVSVGGSSKRLEMRPGEQQTLLFREPPYFVYHYLNPSCLYTVVVEPAVGVSPRTQPEGSDDWRYLGAMLEFWVVEAEDGD